MTDVEEWWGDTDMPEEVASLIKALASAWRVVLGHRGRGTRRTDSEPELVRQGEPLLNPGSVRTFRPIDSNHLN